MGFTFERALSDPQLPVPLPAASAARTTGYERICFVASETAEAINALQSLKQRYGHRERGCADVIVALGGDGLMLRTMHKHLGEHIPVFGMNCGSLGFLMNEFREDGLLERLQLAELNTVHPLRMVAVDAAGAMHEALAINEVSLFRASHQAAKLRVTIDSMVRIPELVCDGILLATPVGSTAYNLSVGGPVLPLGAPLMALTPISPFRPRRWRGAVLPDRAQVRIEMLEADKRPVAAVANHREFRDVREVTISVMRDISLSLLFDPGHALDERILSEQFQF